MSSLGLDIGLYAITAGIIGMFIGSFANVIAVRWFSRKSAWTGRSECPNCKKMLHWWELIPILSFLLLGGRCSGCKKPISLRYPLIELLFGAVFYAVTLTILQPPAGLSIITITALLAGLVFFTLSLILFFLDSQSMLLPDSLQFILFIAGLVLTVSGQLSLHSVNLLPNLMGSIIGGLIPLTIVYLTHHRGMGEGDILIGTTAGLVLGVPAIVTMYIIVFILGGLVAGGLLLTKAAEEKSAIPFGPFIVTGLFVVWLMMHWPSLSAYLLW